MLSLSHEGTDYDRVEWNYGTSDDASALTWGPYGATAGHGNEIRGILRLLESTRPDLLLSLCGDDCQSLRKFLEAPARDGYALLKPIFRSDSSRARWTNLLAGIGSSSDGRAAYERYAFESEEWLKPALRQLYTLIPDSERTEVDYAFFIDVAIHMSIGPKRIARAMDALHSAAGQRALSPAERRQVISRTLIPTNQRRDRLGRNVVYYIDRVGTEGLSPDELAAWKKRTGRRASDCGLSDSRSYTPPFLK